MLMHSLSLSQRMAMPIAQLPLYIAACRLMDIGYISMFLCDSCGPT